MAKFFKKAMLYAGREYQSPDGTVSVTSDRLKRWHDGFQKLKENNYVVPADWDHVADLSKAAPVAMSKTGKQRSAKNTVGKLHAFNPAPDFSHAEVIVEITDPVAQGRADRNEVYISPVIFEKWKDGAGNEYSDLITHVDIVNHPVDNSQGPFVPVEPGTLAMGIRMGLSPVYRLALDDDEDRKPFGDPDGDDEGDELPDGNDDPTDVEDKNEDMPKVQGDDKCAEAIRAHLEQLGLGVPSDWSMTSEGADKILLGCLKTLVNAQQKADAEKASGKGDEDEPNGDDEMGKLADPGFAAMSLEVKQLREQLETTRREKLQSALDGLRDSGRMTAADHAEKSTELSTVRMSLDSKKEPTFLDLLVVELGKVPAGTFFTPEQRTKASTVAMSLAHPAAHQTLDSDAEGVEYGMQLAGVAPKAAK
ncbi:MAG TPA: hypothetical protein VM165_25240 [Planctomycetaceae bacterium]|nr:hypothetical protein [Planctomycetaceae bacterium]